MQRLMPRLLGLALLLAPLCVLQAQTAEPVQETAGQEATTTREAQEQAKRESDVNDRYCLRHTGTLIRHHARTADRRARCTSHFGRVYTREDLDRTGRIDIADALRALDPSIY